MLQTDDLLIRQDGFALAANWSVPAQARVAIIGPSGGGKSTLLMTIAGFIRPTRGRVLWQGRDLDGVPPGERPMSILFQDQNLFPHLTIGQNLGLGLNPRLQLGPADHRRIEETLRRVGLDGMSGRKPAQLSGGQIARAALARAMLRAQPLLLLDEPFAALGPGLRAEMLDLVAEVATQNGATVLMVTHDPSDALRLGGLAILVADGVALPPRPVEELLADPPPALRAYLGR